MPSCQRLTNTALNVTLNCDMNQLLSHYHFRSLRLSCKPVSSVAKSHVPYGIENKLKRSTQGGFQSLFEDESLLNLFWVCSSIQPPSGVINLLRTKSTLPSPNPKAYPGKKKKKKRICNLFFDLQPRLQTSDTNRESPDGRQPKKRTLRLDGHATFNHTDFTCTLTDHGVCGEIPRQEPREWHYRIIGQKDAIQYHVDNKTMPNLDYKSITFK